MEYSMASSPQQNRIAKMRNRTLIEAARTMLTDSKLPTTFWAEAVNTACYVKNRVLVVKPYFKTPYELFKGRSPALSFMRPFGCHVTILNTLDQLGKFVGKSDEGIFVAYSIISKAFRVYNIRTRKVEKNLHITFLENKPMIAGGGPEWLFDIDALSESINYALVPACINSNDFAGKGSSFDAGQSSLETGSSQDYILMPLWKNNSLFDSYSQDSDGYNKDKHVNTATLTYTDYPSDPFMPNLEDTGIFDDMEPKKVAQDLDDESWVEAMQEELLQIEAIMLFLAYASYTDFTVYQMDVKSAFLYGTIEEEVYVSQTPGFVDPEFPDRVYKVEKALYGLHQAPRACVKSASTPMETHKLLSKDANVIDVDVHLYRYLKGQPTLGLWYPKDSPLELIAYFDSDYTGASLDRKSTTGGLELKGYWINNGYPDLVQHAGD
uniref:Retrovirus-related Pol polyprotein from transposon TNT 1-94 n=1 Tax=Tanacetum cinerariifolium TaxID=118510 RepID=A0A699HQH3_TANCI|nr:retrovirus-related Pol polyprotein from transposon TNT 1-94 [Tanacetum cinerariifolium]